MKYIDVISFLNSDIDVLGLSVKSYNCLKRSNIKTVGDLLSLCEADIKQVRNLGIKGIEEVKKKISDKISNYPGLKIGMSPSEIKDLGIPLFYFHEDIREGISEILAMPINALNLNTKAFNFMSRNGIRTIRQLVSIEKFSSLVGNTLTEKDISRISEQLSVIAGDYPDVHLYMSKEHLAAIPILDLCQKAADDSLEIDVSSLNYNQKVELYHTLFVKREHLKAQLEIIDAKLATIGSEIGGKKNGKQ